MVTWKTFSISSSALLPPAPPPALLPHPSSHLCPASDNPPPPLRGDQGLHLEVLGQPSTPSQFPRPPPTSSPFSPLPPDPHPSRIPPPASHIPNSPSHSRASSLPTACSQNCRSGEQVPLHAVTRAWKLRFWFNPPTLPGLPPLVPPTSSHLPHLSGDQGLEAEVLSQLSR